MLSAIGARLLPWLDEVVMREAFQALALFDTYVGRWRELLDV